MIICTASDKPIKNHRMADCDNRWNNQIYVFADDFIFVEPKHFLKGIWDTFYLTDISNKSYVHNWVTIWSIDTLIAEKFISTPSGLEIDLVFSIFTGVA